MQVVCYKKKKGRVYQTNDQRFPSSNQIVSVFPLVISVDIIISAQWSPVYLVQRDSAARNHQMICYVSHKVLYILTFTSKVCPKISSQIYRMIFLVFPLQSFLSIWPYITIKSRAPHSTLERHLKLRTH